MLFWVNIDGYRVAVQAVKRGEKAYWRLAPYTLIYPTPKQRSVRNTLSIASHGSAEKSWTELNDNVAAAFDGWERTEPEPNKTHLALREIYGDEADKVLEYITKQKQVSQILSTSKNKEYINKEIEKVVFA